MKQKTEFLTIFATYGNLELVKKTLPSVIEETNRYPDAQLIVHDSTQLQHGREEKWEWLKELEVTSNFFLLLSTNLSMAHARNMCLHLGQELFAPEYICMLEDDHGYRSELIPNMISAMKKYYGKISPNGLRYGMFSACTMHTTANIKSLDENISYPSIDSSPFDIGGFNSCFRCAPTHHWNNVLKGYDTDEYLISNFQTAQLRWRNYNKGFTVAFVGNGDLILIEDGDGRGESDPNALKLWDREYTASDRRSKYALKSAEDNKIADAHRNRLSNKVSDIAKRLKKKLVNNE